MNEEEFLKIFGKTTFIEHLSKNQQRELYETVKELISESKVKEVIDKLIESEGDIEHQRCVDGEELKKELE